MSSQMPTFLESLPVEKFPTATTIPTDESKVVVSIPLGSSDDKVVTVTLDRPAHKTKNPEKQTNFTDEEISAISIGRDGFFIENWSSTITIPAKIVEINNEYVLMDCMMDEGANKIEKRSFNRSMIKESDLCIEGIIVIKIFERPGKITHEFINGSNLGFEQYFKDNFDFNTLDLGKPIR